MKMRTTLAGVLAVLALSVSLVAFGGTREAVADNGDPVILGTSNYASGPTFVLMNSLSSTSTRDAALVADHQADANDIEPVGIWGTAGNQLFARPVGFQIGVLGTSQGDGVMGVASRNGVFGLTSNNGASGVYGENDGTGYGVAGRATNASSGTGVLGDGAITGVLGISEGAGDGVDGQANNSCCSAVYGLNTGTGNGVAGRADKGTGVLAASTGGIALKVSGKTQFSRSGVATVAGTSSTPKHSVKVTLPITAKSMMTAMLQKFVSGVSVVAAVPNVSGGYFTIYLNKSVTTSVGPIAWMVMERP